MSTISTTVLNTLTLSSFLSLGPKGLIDICMMITLYLSFPKWKISPLRHGIVCSLFPLQKISETRSVIRILLSHVSHLEFSISYLASFISHILSCISHILSCISHILSCISHFYLADIAFLISHIAFCVLHLAFSILPLAFSALHIAFSISNLALTFIDFFFHLVKVATPMSLKGFRYLALSL